MSTMPGITSAPSASISRSALPSTVPTSAMTPPRTATSAVRTSEPVPSMTEPLRMIRSKSAMRQSRVVAASFTTRAYTGCSDRSSKVPSVVEEAGQDDPSLGVLRERRRRWWHRHLASEERQRVMTELAIRRPDHGSFRFAVMITLSVIVAVMGMSANSAAVVIGAMLLAPMMQPVLATAACIAMALFGKAVQAFGIVLFATVGSIVLAYVLSALFGSGEIPNEVTSRTAPDIRDLVVALAAGTATFAWGAILLYTTNLIAIVYAGVVVFVLTGFVPPRRLANTFRRSSLVAATVGVFVVAIALPLYGASTAAVERSEREIEALDIVSTWLGPTDRRQAPSVSFDGDRITVAVRSFDTPPDPEPLIADLQTRFGVGRIVSIEWDRVDQATTTTTRPPSTTIVSDEEQLVAEVEEIVDRWLADLDDGGRRDALSVVDDVIRLDASGTVDAPSLESLTTLLDDELDRSFEVQLTWLERESISGSAPTPTPEQVLADRLDLLARDWASTREVEVLSTGFDGSEAVIEL